MNSRKFLSSCTAATENQFFGRIHYCLLIVLLLLIFPMQASLQVESALSPELIENSERIHVKIRGGGAMFRPEISSYKVIKVKHRFSDNVGESRIHNILQSASGWEKAHYFFQYEQDKTMVVNQALIDSMIHKERVTTPFFEIGRDGLSFGSRFHTVHVWTESLFASMMDKTDSVEWALSMVNLGQNWDLGQENDSEGWSIRIYLSDPGDLTVPEVGYVGLLTNGDIDIGIVEGVLFIEGGIFPRPVHWFEFYLDDKAIAAVTQEGITVNKIYARFHKNLDKGIERYIAAAIASILDYVISPG